LEVLRYFVSAHKARTLKARIPKVRILKARTLKARTLKARTPKVRTPKVRTPKVRTLKLRTPKVRILKFRILKARTPKVRILKVRTHKVRTLKVRILKFRILKARILKVRTQKVRILKFRTPKVRTPKVRTLKVRTAKVRTLKVRIRFYYISIDLHSFYPYGLLLVHIQTDTLTVGRRDHHLTGDFGVVHPDYIGIPLKLRVPPIRGELRVPRGAVGFNPTDFLVVFPKALKAETLRHLPTGTDEPNTDNLKVCPGTPRTYVV
jgi:hypothetical protein